tara:strand:- start:28260 stop:28733 length:474 start_codon:yes stop_codon:yes gene_type:complete
MANITKDQLEKLVMQQAETIARLEAKVDGGSSAVEESPKKSQCFTFGEFIEGPVTDSLKKSGCAVEVKENVLCIYQRLDVDRGVDEKTGEQYKTIINTNYVPKFNPITYCRDGELKQDPVHEGNKFFRSFHPVAVREGKQIALSLNIQAWDLPTAKK